MTKHEAQLGFLSWVLLVAGVGMILISPPQPLAASTPDSTHLVASSAAGVEIEFVFPSYVMEQVEIEGETFIRPNAEGYATQGAPGAPALPQLGMLVGLPPSGSYRLEILDAEISTVSLVHPVVPALRELRAPEGTLPSEAAFEVVRDDAVYGRDAFSPAASVTVREVDRVRGQRLVRVAYHPMQYNPVTGELRITERVRVALRFEWNRNVNAEGAERLRSVAFDAILGSTVVNWDQAQAWQVAPQPSTAGAGASGEGWGEASLPAWMAGSFDYIVITHPDFWSAIDPLVARRAQDMDVVKVNVQDIYDEFGTGAVDPAAIQSYISYAYENWNPAPTYVLLVGNATDGTPSGTEWNKIPPYIANVDKTIGETSADNRYGAVDGEGGLQGLAAYPPLADVLIGRLPATTASQVTTMVNKILAYEQAEPEGAWNRRHVFVAADDAYVDKFPEGKGPEDIFVHVDVLEELYETYLKNSVYQTRKVYKPAMARSEFIAQIMDAWQEGAWLMVYSGHAHWHAWWDDPKVPYQDPGYTDGDLFHYQDEVSQLTNGDRLPVVLALTCLTGYHHHPEYAVLDEALLRKAGGGAVAVWSSSGFGAPEYHSVLIDGFYEWVLRHERTGSGAPADVIGWAAAYGKLQLIAAYEDHPEWYTPLIETYHLFGDPAMALNTRVPELGNDVFVPLVLRGN